MRTSAAEIAVTVVVVVEVAGAVVVGRWRSTSLPRLIVLQ